MFVIGTAGHVDHGKSLLISALTGIDPDRLREEKERGMTIDLGFAWMKLLDGQEVGIIDVPGHERFVKNMLAGVGGIDLALLVVAADEGVMPQTREHLAIIDLLDINKGVVVITKKDLVDGELLSLVKLEVEELIESTTLSGAPVVAVSAVNGDGLPELVESIDRVLSTTEPKQDIGRPRLTIDRAFTIAGSGTVVTGTLIDGTLSVGQDVEILPVGLKTRLRGLQTHKSHIDIANPGSRVAANLAGLATSQLQRGYVLTSPGWLSPTDRVDVKLRMLADVKHPLHHGATVSFFSGAAEMIARVHLLQKERLDAADISWAQLALTESLVVVKGDHFIIRSTMDTLGGGVVVDAHAPRHRRFRPSLIQSLKIRSDGTLKDMVVATLETSQPLDLHMLVVHCNLANDKARELVSELTSEGRLVTTGQAEQSLLFTDSGWRRFVKKAESVIESYHRKFPARPGMSKGELGSKLGLLTNSPALRKLIDDGVIVDNGAVVRLSSYKIKLTQQQQTKIDDFLAVLNKNPFSPQGDITLESDLLGLLIQQHKVVRVGENIFFSASAYDEMVAKVVAYTKAKGKVTLAEVRDMLGTSRKYAQALLEHMDEKKLTRRVGDERILR